MAGAENRVIVYVGVDDSKLRVGLAKTPKTVEDGLNKTATKAKTSGKNVGDQFGQGLQNSTKKYMTVTEDLLRRMFGKWGNILAVPLKLFRDLSDARESALKQTSKELAGQAAGQVGGKVAGTVAEAGLTAGGVYAATRTGTFQGALSGTSAGMRYGQPSQAERLRLTRAPMGESSRPSMMSSVREQLGRTIGYNLGRLGPLAALGVGASAGIGGALGGLGIVAAVAKSRTKEIEREKEIFSAKALLAEIDKITDGTARAKKIMEEFGSGGTKKMEELRESVKKYNQEQNWGSKELRVFGERSKMLWDSITTGVKKASKFVLNYVGGSIAWASNRLSGLTSEMIDLRREGEANIAILEKKLDESRQNRVKRDEEAAREAEKKRAEDERIEEQIEKEREDRRVEDLSNREQLKESEEKVTKLKAEQLALDKTTTEYKKIELAIEQEITRQKKLQKEIDKEDIGKPTPGTTPVDPNAPLQMFGPSLQDVGIWPAVPGSGGRYVGTAGTDYGFKYTDATPQENAVSKSNRIKRQWMERATAAQMGPAIAAEIRRRRQAAANPLADPESLKDLGPLTKDDIMNIKNKVQAGLTGKIPGGAEAKKDPFYMMAEAFAKEGALPVKPKNGTGGTR
jgi:hypothetical protein